MTHQVNNSFNPSALVDLLAQSDETVREVADRVEDYATSVAPVDTGALKASIKVQRLGPSHYRVGSALNYAAPVELGHHTESGSFVPAQPYLRPALDAAQVTE